MPISPSEILAAWHQGFVPISAPGRVLIIGAGMAGLSAAHFLQQSGHHDFLLLEARADWGGRIQTWSEGQAEAGAEEVHGENTAWFALLKQKGILLEPYEDKVENYYAWPNGLKTETQLSRRPDFRQSLDYWEALRTSPAQPPLSWAQWLKKQGYGSEVAAFFTTKIENAYGASLSQLNVPDVLRMGRAWSAGEENFLLENRTFASLLEQFFSSLRPRIHCQAIVQKIDYQQAKIFVHTQDGQILEADKVLVTVPVSQLQNDRIAFEPALPPSKKQALSHIHLAPVLKLILVFEQAFWPEEMGSLYLDDAIGEYYTSGLGPWPTLTGYVAGSRAAQLSAEGEAKGLEMALQALDRVWGDKKASRFYKTHYWADWSKVPHIEGGYSYPGLQSESHRKALREPLDARVFFAGEATHTRGHAGTVHGALETAFWAVAEMLGVVQP
ncbi:MAG: FAD-dependent oxidoreductase [Microscillaceae bacterium]